MRAVRPSLRFLKGMWQRGHSDCQWLGRGGVSFGSSMRKEPKRRKCPRTVQPLSGSSRKCLPQVRTDTTLRPVRAAVSMGGRRPLDPAALGQRARGFLEQDE